MDSTIEGACKALRRSRQTRLALKGSKAQGFRQGPTGVVEITRDYFPAARTSRALGEVVAALPERVMRADEGRSQRLEAREQSEDEHGQARTGTDAERPFDCAQGDREDGSRARMRCFVPFKWFYGGWLVYELAGVMYRQYLPTNVARGLGLAFTVPI